MSTNASRERRGSHSTSSLQLSILCGALAQRACVSFIRTLFRQTPPKKCCPEIKYCPGQVVLSMGSNTMPLKKSMAVETENLKKRQKPRGRTCSSRVMVTLPSVCRLQAGCSIRVIQVISCRKECSKVGSVFLINQKFFGLFGKNMKQIFEFEFSASATALASIGKSKSV